MTFLEALKAARELIESKVDTYICYAFHRAGADEYRDQILDLLSPSLSYEGWLCQNHYSSYKIMEQAAGNAFQQGRLQWLDHMIKEENQAEYERLSKWDLLAGLVMPPSAYGLTDYPA